MNLKVGIVGLPNVGKSTLFNALTKKAVPAENYPFCTIDPSVGVVPVPDERLDKLNDFSKSEKKIPAIVEFVDIAGLVKGASEGEGLGNKFLANIREVDAICEMVRIFEDDDIIHVSGKIDPLSDIETINIELILADLQVVEKRLVSIEKEVKRGDKDAKVEFELLQKLKIHLGNEKNARDIKIEEEEEKFFKHLQLLSAKPIIYLLNKKTGGKNLDEHDSDGWNNLQKYFRDTSAEFVFIDASSELDMNNLSKTEREEMRSGLGVSGGIDELIRKAYETLGLITFLTTGEKESRAWTIYRGSTAPIAGSAIHTDFEKKFVKAEVIEWNKLLEAGSYGKAREQGLVRLEGKEYIVKDGDVIEFKVAA